MSSIGRTTKDGRGETQGAHRHGPDRQESIERKIEEIDPQDTISMTTKAATGTQIATAMTTEQGVAHPLGTGLTISATDPPEASSQRLQAFRPLLAYYLDLQKGKILSRMDDREAKGRWKSFLKKWNQGQLSEGWYDPEMFVAANERLRDMSPEPEPVPSRRGEPSQVRDDENHEDPWGSDDEDDDDDMGPALPPTSRISGQRSGPGIPNLDELATRREERSEEAQAIREQEIADLRYARKQDRKLQKERLEELVPRADAGSHERRLEKRAAVNDKMRSFRDKSPGGDAAVGDGDLMGGGDGIDEIKRQKAENERRKTEREIRREEIARAKAEEREERLKEWREREEGTMKALKELARQRFG